MPCRGFRQDKICVRRSATDAPALLGRGDLRVDKNVQQTAVRRIGRTAAFVMPGTSCVPGVSCMAGASGMQGRGSLQERLLSFISNDGLYVVFCQLLPSLQTGKFHQEEDPDHLAAETLDEMRGCFDGAAGCDQIIDEDDLLARLYGIGVYLDFGAAVF